MRLQFARNWQGALLSTLLATMLFARASGQAPVHYPHGIYIYSEHLPEDGSDLSKALPVQGVDGLTLVLDWNQLEPDKGSFTWTILDNWMSAAAGKQIALAVRAGQGTPCWLFQAPACGAKYGKPYAGAAGYNFLVSNREGIGQTSCNTETVAAPWDSVFLTEWDVLLAAIATHLQSAGTYDALTSLRLTGIDRTTSELRMPAEVLTSPCVMNSIATWLTAGFRPAKLLAAWDTLTDSFLKHFPDKYFGVEIIPVASGGNGSEYPFPAIDDSGCAYQPPWPTSQTDPNYPGATCFNTSKVPDQNAPLLSLASKKFAGRLSVSYQNIDPKFAANYYPPYAAQTWGTAVGYQTNDYNNLHAAACSGDVLNPGPCTAASYLALLEIGIYPLGKSNSLRAQYIEVLPPDTVSFPSAILQAHQELLPPPALSPNSVANAATYISGGLVPGSWAQVKGTGLSYTTRVWSSADFAALGNDLPTTLDGVQVKVDNLPAALYFIDPGQVSFQVPAGVSGTASVQVINNGQTSNTVTGTAANTSPGIFPIIVNGVNYAAGVFLDGKLVGDPSIGSNFRKAKPGDTIQLYATGLAPSPAGVLANFSGVSGVTVTIGSVTFPAEAAGLVTVGEFQINVVVPQQFALLPEANYPVTITVNNISSPATIDSAPPGPLVIPIQH